MLENTFTHLTREPVSLPIFGTDATSVASSYLLFHPQNY